jgi:hypothetical protein
MFRNLISRIRYHYPFFRDPLRKNIPLIIFEYLKFRFTNKRIAEQYFSKYFYRKGSKNYDNYLLTDRIERKIWGLNNKVYIPLMNDKYLFEKYFSQYGLRVVKSLAHNYNSIFYVNNSLKLINTIDEFRDFLELLLSEEICKKGIFIKRISDSYGGAGIYRILPGDLESDRSGVENLFNVVVNSQFLFQEIVQQNEKINQINPHCINTIRIETFSNRSDEIKIVSGFMRIGINKSHVDNISSGGIFAGIDIETGRLYPEAFSDVVYGQGKIYTSHPDTGFSFEGFQIPYFNELKKLVLTAAGHVPRLKIIGWDAAIDPEGPVLIEGNTTPGMTVSETAQKGFYNNPVFLEILKEIK